MTSRTVSPLRFTLVFHSSLPASGLNLTSESSAARLARRRSSAAAETQTVVVEVVVGGAVTVS